MRVAFVEIGLLLFESVWWVLDCVGCADLFCFNSVGGYLFCFVCGFNCVMLLLGGFMVDSVLR